MLRTSNKEASLQETWFIGICLAIMGSYLTSLSSYYQKRILMNEVPLGIIIKYRFAPTVIILGISFFFDIDSTKLNTGIIAKVGLIGAVTFAAPLVFLNFGLLRSSLGRFSSYILLIPLYTFFIASILIYTLKGLSFLF